MSSRRNRARDERSALQQRNPEVSLNDVTDAIFGAELSTIDTNYPVMLPLDQITIHDEIQVRLEGLDEEWIETLVNVLENGGELTPVEVYQDGAHYILADGFHRVEAYKRTTATQVKALVRSGGYAGAVERAEEANLEHGLQLTTESKRHILLRRLQRGHPWAELSDRELARRLGVSAPTIGNWIRAFRLAEHISIDRTKTVGADGKKRDTSNISTHDRKRSPISPQRAYQMIESLAERDGLLALLRLPMDKRKQLAELFSEWGVALLEAERNWIDEL
jgi:uncharacterized ParB-like nuclease family protein